MSFALAIPIRNDAATIYALLHGFSSNGVDMLFLVYHQSKALNQGTRVIIHHQGRQYRQSPAAYSD